MSIEPRSHEVVLPRTTNMHSCSFPAIAGSSMYCGEWHERGGRGEGGKGWSRRVVIQNKVSERGQGKDEVGPWQKHSLAIHTNICSYLVGAHVATCGIHLRNYDQGREEVRMHVWMHVRMCTCCVCVCVRVHARTRVYVYLWLLSALCTLRSAKVARLWFLQYVVYTSRSTFDICTNTLPICSLFSSIAEMSASLI